MTKFLPWFGGVRAPTLYLCTRILMRLHQYTPALKSMTRTVLRYVAALIALGSLLIGVVAFAGVPDAVGAARATLLVMGTLSGFIFVAAASASGLRL